MGAIAEVLGGEIYLQVSGGIYDGAATLHTACTGMNLGCGVGGLIGKIFSTDSRIDISQSSFEGEILAPDFAYVGGLIGDVSTAGMGHLNIEESFAHPHKLVANASDSFVGSFIARIDTTSMINIRNNHAWLNPNEDTTNNLEGVNKGGFVATIITGSPAFYKNYVDLRNMNTTTEPLAANFFASGGSATYTDNFVIHATHGGVADQLGVPDFNHVASGVLTQKPWTWEDSLQRLMPEWFVYGFYFY